MLRDELTQLALLQYPETVAVSDIVPIKELKSGVNNVTIKVGARENSMLCNEQRRAQFNMPHDK